MTPIIPIIESSDDGQLSQIDMTDNGGQLVNRQIEWTYYETGEVDTITVILLDALNNEIERTVIKHYTDGRQPEANK